MGIISLFSGALYGDIGLFDIQNPSNAPSVPADDHRITSDGNNYYKEMF